MSTEPAIVSGTYADLRFVRSRSVVQVIVELPIEAAPEFVRLFGAPNPGAEAWVTLARLVDKLEQPVKKERRPWPTLSPTEQSAIRCNEQSFEQFLNEVYGIKGTTADFVRDFCRVKSRAELATNKEAAELWTALDKKYQNWMDEPRIIG